MKDPIIPAQPSPVVSSEILVPDKQYYHAVTAVPIDDSSSDLQLLLTFLKRRFWVVLGVFVLAMMGLGYHIWSQPPRYKGSFRLLVEPLSNENDRVEQTLGIGASLNNYGGLDYSSQIEVLKSQVALKPIVAEIEKKYAGFTYDQLVDGLGITNPNKTKILEISYSSGNAQQVEFVLTKLADGFVRYSIFERYANLQRGVEFVDQQIAQQRQEVNRLEAWIEQFRRQNDLFQPEDYAKDLSFQLAGILSKRRELQAQLASAQTLNARLQEQLGMNPAEAVVVSTLSEAPVYQDLINKLREVESQIALQSARFQDDSPIIQDLVEQRKRLMPLLAEEAQRIISRSQVAKEGANVQTLGFQGSVGRDLGKQLVEAANQVKILQAQSEALAKTEAELRQQTKSLAGVTRSYDGVQRNLKISNDSLNRLLEARETLQLDRTKQVNPWQLISEINAASILDASGKSRQYSLATIAALLIGVVVAWVVDKLDQAYHKPEDLSQDLGLPCLGQIPRSPQLAQANRRPLHQRLLQSTGDITAVLRRTITSQDEGGYGSYASSSFMESFYSLYANIRLMSTDESIRVLTVASASPGDGKSTVSINLALAAATMGYRVVLIDADLRWPRLHEKIQLENLRGFSNWLTNDGLSLTDLVQLHPEEEGLSILTAGPTPPDPPRLLSSNRLRHLIDQLKTEFDLVVFDTPPLGQFVDGKLLASLSDGTLMVASLKKTDRNILKRLVQEFRTSINAPLLGCVANGVTVSAFGPYYQYYQYYGRPSAGSS